MTTWVLLSTIPVPPGPIEQWNLVSLSSYLSTPNLRHWGFRVKVLESTPPSVNTLGHWGWYQRLGGLDVVGPTHVIPLIGRGSNQMPLIISEDDYTNVPVGQTDVGIAYSVASWVDATDFELWGYTYS